MKKPEEVNLLIVDDEPLILEAMETQFKMDGHKVFTASDGKEGLSIVKNNSIDMVISDVAMPNGDGIFLLEEIKKMNTLSPQVLLLTGFSELTKEEAIKKGALDLLNKPVDPEILEGFVKDHLKIIE